MGAGDADGVFVGFHDLAPGLGPLEHGNACAAGSGDFRVVIVDGGGTNHAVRALDIFAPVPDGHMNPMLLQFLGGERGAHIGAGNLQAHALEHQSQWPHGDAANANQVHPPAGNNIFRNIICFHTKNNSLTRVHIHTILNYTP